NVRVPPASHQPLSGFRLLSTPPCGAALYRSRDKSRPSRRNQVPRKNRLHAARSRNHRRLTSRARPRIVRPTHLVRRATDRPGIRLSSSMTRCRLNKLRWTLLVFPFRLVLILLYALATVRVNRLRLTLLSLP